MWRWRTMAPAAALLAVAACAPGEGARGADTTVPGPAEIDRSETPGAPDSTSGVAPENGTGRPGVAGDSTGREDPRSSVPTDSITQRGDGTRRTP